MWGLNNLQPESSRNNQMAHYNAMRQIHVLVVEHETQCLLNTVKLLELCQYKVTIVEYASAAIQMLTSGKVKFDMVMANNNSPDLHALKLLQHAVNMDLPFISMGVDDNAFTAMRALENGAFLYMKKPATIDTIKFMWQHVVKEKIRVMKERERLAAANYALRGKTKEKVRPRNDMSDDGDYDDNKNSKLSRKVCTEWTQELHAKFMDAIEQLGDGRCFPKEILEVMDVPGLTRMQVASHLQKCRNENWRSPEDRKMSQALVSDGEGSSQSKVRRFGSMPRLGKSPLSSQTRSEREPDHGNTQNNNISYLGQVIEPGPIHATSNNISTPVSHRRHNSDDLFNYPSMDCFIQDFSGMTSQGFHAMNINANQNQGPYHYDPVFTDQKSAVRMDTRNQWSSEKSSFGSDDSDTRANE